MKQQDYVLKKYVRASSAIEAIQLDTVTPVSSCIASIADDAIEAIQLDTVTPVSECFLTTDKPIEASASAIGFQWLHPDTDQQPESRRS